MKTRKTVNENEKKKRCRYIIIVFESGMAQTDYGFREMLL